MPNIEPYNKASKRCEDKVAYMSELDAVNAMAKMVTRKRQTSMRVYQCNICGHYHITTKQIRHD